MAAVADRAQAVPSPPSGLAPEPLRSRLALAAADAVACVFLASAWVFFAASPVLAVGRLACEGDDCPASHPALIVTISAAVPAFVVCPLAMELLIHYMSDSGPEEKQGPATSSAPIMVKVSDCFVILYVVAQLAFIVLAMVGVAVHASWHLKGSTKERVGLAIMGLGFYGFCWLPCLVLFPAMALDVWRKRRAGWRWGGKFVGKPSRGATAVMMGKEPEALSIC